MSTDDRFTPRPEQPRSEPEIIPPDHSRARGSAGDDGVFVFIDERGGARRIYTSQPGPFSILFGFLVAGLVLAGMLLLAFGVIVLLVPVIVLTAAALIAYFYLRGSWRRLLSRRPN